MRRFVVTLAALAAGAGSASAWVLPGTLPVQYKDGAEVRARPADALRFVRRPTAHAGGR
jgi:hypothetical protein